ncbi:MAG: hypothetical protein JW801_12695 [Bacteroidales bacterium]|nr:hypothetical protein [Bacteroidales bacterium]
MNLKPLWMMVLIGFVFFSCRQEEQKKDPKEQETASVKIALCESLNPQSSDLENSDNEGFGSASEVYYRFPSPDEMLGFINHEEYDYNADLLSPAAASDNYLDSKSQSLNLGIYLADLAYITLLNRQREGISYFKLIHDLSDKLRISSAFAPGILKRFESNLDNLDSLKVLIDESVTDIIFYLERENKGKEMALISIGGFIEALYLAFNLVDSYSEDNLIVQRIADQKLVLDNILRYICANPGDANVAYAVDLLVPVWQVYANISQSSQDTRVERRNGKLVIRGGIRNSITEEEYLQLKQAVFNARTRIIGNPEK